MPLGPVLDNSVRGDASRDDSGNGHMHKEYKPAAPYGTPAQSPEGTKTMLLRRYADLGLQQDQWKRHKERMRERKAYLAAGASVAVVLLLTIALVSIHVFSSSNLPQMATIFRTTPPVHGHNATSWFLPAINGVYGLQLDSELDDQGEGFQVEPVEVAPKSSDSEKSAFEKCRRGCVGEGRPLEKSRYDMSSVASTGHDADLVRRDPMEGSEETGNTVGARCLEECGKRVDGKHSLGDEASLSDTTVFHQEYSERRSVVAPRDARRKKTGESDIETTSGRVVSEPFDGTGFVTDLTALSSNVATVPNRLTIDGTHPDRNRSDVTNIVPNGARHGTCLDKCEFGASSVEKELDRSRDACGDLYAHVCSRWESRYRGLAELRGSYSFDDLVIDRYAKYLGRLLTDVSSPFPAERELFAECLGGSLTAEAERIVWSLTRRKVERVEDVVEVVVLFTRLGISPFFEVALNVRSNTVVVKTATKHWSETLLPDVETSSGQYNYSRDSQPDNDVPINGSTSSGQPSNRTDKSTFLMTLQRRLCDEILGSLQDVIVCNFAPPSQVPPLWNLDWYVSTGVKHLALAASSKFARLLEGKSQQISNPSIPSSHNAALPSSTARLRDCLTFIDENDPEFLARLSVTRMPPASSDAAREDIRKLNEILEENDIYNVTISSPFDWDLPDSSGNSSLEQTASTVRYESMSGNTSTLERFLKRSAWKRWTGASPWQSSGFSTEAAFASQPRRLEVPLPVFNVDTYKDPLQRHVSLARTGPRILRPIFRNMSPEELRGLGLYRCMERHASNGSADSNFSVVEVMSFHYSYEAYSQLLRADGKVPGAYANSLFLLHYVFDNCNASGPIDDRADLSRLRVQSVARKFVGLLLDKCRTTTTKTAGCFFRERED